MQLNATEDFLSTTSPYLSPSAPHDGPSAECKQSRPSPAHSTPAQPSPLHSTLAPSAEREHWQNAVFIAPRGTPPLSASTTLRVAYDDYEMWMDLAERSRSDPAERSRSDLAARSRCDLAGRERTLDVARRQATADADSGSHTAAGHGNGRAREAGGPARPARPVCTCGMHALWGPERLGQLNALDHEAAAMCARRFVLQVNLQVNSSQLNSKQRGGTVRLLDLGDGPLWSMLVGQARRPLTLAITRTLTLAWTLTALVYARLPGIPTVPPFQNRGAS